jgi:3-oxoacyl-[acyl-carrier protein] reductase
MDVSLAGRTAVITGGSKGIGLAVATRFAASGADVATADAKRSTMRSRPSARTAGVSSASRATWRSPLTSSVPTRK